MQLPPVMVTNAGAFRRHLFTAAAPAVCDAAGLQSGGSAPFTAVHGAGPSAAFAA